MKLQRFLTHAETMRKGGISCAVAPRSFGLMKARAHHCRKMEQAYAAIFRFAIKHPDSTRTSRARFRTIERNVARQLKSAVTR